MRHSTSPSCSVQLKTCCIRITKRKERLLKIFQQRKPPDKAIPNLGFSLRERKKKLLSPIGHPPAGARKKRVVISLWGMGLNKQKRRRHFSLPPPLLYDRSEEEHRVLLEDNYRFSWIGKPNTPLKPTQPTSPGYTLVFRWRRFYNTESRFSDPTPPPASSHTPKPRVHGALTFSIPVCENASSLRARLYTNKWIITGPWGVPSERPHSDAYISQNRKSRRKTAEGGWLYRVYLS